jgi:hypothetical protein
MDSARARPQAGPLSQVFPSWLDTPVMARRISAEAIQTVLDACRLSVRRRKNLDCFDGVAVSQ